MNDIYYERICSLAEQSGFSHWGKLNMDALVLRDEVRAMCADNKCGKYEKHWTCPPYCGTLPELREKIASYSCGILLQSTGQMEDDFDLDCIFDTGDAHKTRIYDMSARIKKELPELPVLPISAGGCDLCETCTCPDAPCRFPEKAIPSMEAYGLLVNDVCKGSGIPYTYGPKTITYVSCLLYGKKAAAD